MEKKQLRSLNQPHFRENYCFFSKLCKLVKNYEMLDFSINLTSGLLCFCHVICSLNFFYHHFAASFQKSLNSYYSHVTNSEKLIIARPHLQGIACKSMRTEFSHKLQFVRNRVPKQCRKVQQGVAGFYGKNQPRSLNQPHFRENYCFFSKLCKLVKNHEMLDFSINLTSGLLCFCHVICSLNFFYHHFAASFQKSLNSYYSHVTNSEKLIIARPHLQGIACKSMRTEFSHKVSFVRNHVPKQCRKVQQGVAGFYGKNQLRSLNQPHFRENYCFFSKLCKLVKNHEMLDFSS